MRILAFTCTLLLATSVFAEGKKTAKKAVMKTPKIDITNSSLKWTGTKKVLDKHFGTIKLKSGNVEMKNGLITKGAFVVDMNSIDVKDLKGKGKGKLEGHLKSGDFFAVDKHPTATLNVSTQKAKGVLTGTLTIKGIDHPTTIKFKSKGNSHTGTLTFDRTKYGIVYGSKNSFADLALDKIINDEITIDFNIKTL